MVDDFKELRTTLSRLQGVAEEKKRSSDLSWKKFEEKRNSLSQETIDELSTSYGIDLNFMFDKNLGKDMTVEDFEKFKEKRDIACKALTEFVRDAVKGIGDI